MKQTVLTTIFAAILTLAFVSGCTCSKNPENDVLDSSKTPKVESGVEQVPAVEAAKTPEASPTANPTETPVPTETPAPAATVEPISK